MGCFWALTLLHLDPERPGVLSIDDELELGRLHDREVASATGSHLSGKPRCSQTGGDLYERASTAALVGLVQPIRAEFHAVDITSPARLRYTPISDPRTCVRVGDPNAG